MIGAAAAACPLHADDRASWREDSSFGFNAVREWVESLGRVWEFPTIRVPYFGVPIIIIRILLFILGYYIRVPCFRKLPYQEKKKHININFRCWDDTVGTGRQKAGPCQFTGPWVLCANR